MKNSINEDGVRTRLILAALDELCVHGISDFSLRRVAAIAQVSCAAPYRHFKSKEELIAETADYITSKWELLSREIISACAGDSFKTLLALSTAAVRFWVANGNFRSLLIPEPSSELAARMKKFDEPVERFVSVCTEESGGSDATAKRDFVLSLIYGAVVLVTSGKLASEAAISVVSEQLKSVFSPMEKS